MVDQINTEASNKSGTQSTKRFAKTSAKKTKARAPLRARSSASIANIQTPTQHDAGVQELASQILALYSRMQVCGIPEVTISTRRENVEWYASQQMNLQALNKRKH